MIKAIPSRAKLGGGGGLLHESRSQNNCGITKISD